jgi:hypothetical protein
MKPAPSSERAFLIHYARVTLAQARVFRARGQMGFAATLLTWAGNARRRAAAQTRQGEMFGHG